MFNAYVSDRAARKNRKVIWGSFTLAMAMVGAGMVGMVIHSFWTVDRLTPRYRSISFISSVPPPPAPAGAAAPPAIKPKAQTTKQRRTTELVQTRKDPVEVVKPAEPEVVADAHPAGQPDGQVGGVPGGGPGGVVGGDPNVPPGGGTPFGTGTLELPKPTPTPEEPPKVVRIEAIAGQRTAGREQIPLPLDAKIRATKQGDRRLFAAVKLCLDATGAPSRIDLVKSTGYPDADATILAEMRDWRYKPYTVNGRAVAVCSAVTFNYIIED